MAAIADAAATSHEYTTPTRAIVAYAREDWRMEDVLVREPGPHELLVQMVATGICHTDVAGLGDKFPRVLGHEGAGYVLRAHPSVTSAAVGDPVLLTFACCQRCHYCVTGHPAHCVESVGQTFGCNDPDFVLARDPTTVIGGGFFGQSSFSGIALAREVSVVNLRDKGVGKEELAKFAPLGCGMQTGAHALINIARPAKGDAIAVAGLGGVGIAALMAAKAIGLETTIGLDINPTRLELVSALGLATHTLNPASLPQPHDTLPVALKALVPAPAPADPHPLGPAAIIDTTGNLTLLAALLQSVRKLGTVVQLASIKTDKMLPVDLVAHMGNGVRLVGTIQGDSKPPDSIFRLMQWHREGKFALERIEKMFPAEEYAEALLGMAKGDVVKPVLIW